LCGSECGIPLWGRLDPLSGFGVCWLVVCCCCGLCPVGGLCITRLLVYLGSGLLLWYLGVLSCVCLYGCRGLLVFLVLCWFWVFLAGGGFVSHCVGGCFLLWGCAGVWGLVWGLGSGFLGIGCAGCGCGLGLVGFVLFCFAVLLGGLLFSGVWLDPLFFGSGAVRCSGCRGGLVIPGGVCVVWFRSVLSEKSHHWWGGGGAGGLVLVWHGGVWGGVLAGLGGVGFLGSTGCYPRGVVCLGLCCGVVVGVLAGSTGVLGWGLCEIHCGCLDPHWFCLGFGHVCIHLCPLFV